jgi:hypothetical protein
VTPLLFVLLLAALAVALLAVKRFVRSKDVLHGRVIKRDGEE